MARWWPLGQLEQGATIAASAPVFGYSAERGLMWTGRKVKRGLEWLQELHQRGEQEGLSEELEQAADLIEEALKFVSNTSSREKRRLMQDIALGTARRRATAKAIALAYDALQFVEQMTPLAAILWIAVCEEAKPTPYNSEGAWLAVPKDGILLDIPKTRLQAAFSELHRVNLLRQGGGTNAWILQLMHDGEWLREWTQAHPPPEASEARTTAPA